MDYTIEQLDYAYHTLGEPLVSDAVYDRIVTDHSTVGADVEPKADKLTHAVPMLSISSKGSLTSFGVSSGVDEFIVEPKIDGVAISLDYVNGDLVSASTRGNGKVGRNVTAHALACEAIPKKLTSAETLTVRGELYLPLDQFNPDESATARNAVVGAIRLKCSDQFAKRNLSFFAFQIAQHDFTTQSEMMRHIESLGLPFNSESYVCSLNDCFEIFNQIEANRDSYPYDMDGVVIKVNDVSTQEQLGVSSTGPKWAMAKKFTAEFTESEIIDIEYGVGKSGRETAVAVIKPVQLMNKSISRINLYNPMHVSDIGAGIGSRISIEMKNDVIGSLKSVITKMPYTGPNLPEKFVIGSALSFDLDKCLALLD